MEARVRALGEGARVACAIRLEKDGEEGGRYIRGRWGFSNVLPGARTSGGVGRGRLDESSGPHVSRLVMDFIFWKVLEEWRGLESV